MTKRHAAETRATDHGRTLLSLLLGAAVFFSTPAAAQDLADLPEPLIAKIRMAETSCAEFGGGEFSMTWGAVRRVDLDGDFDADWALDEAGFACSSAASLYCGTGGCMSHFVIDGAASALLNRGWRVETFGPRRVLLADVHGSQCDGIGPTPCITASTWDSDERRWRTTGAVWE